MRLRIGAHEWTVTFSKRAVESGSHEMGETLAGWCDRDQHRIAVSPDITRSRQRETVLHESLHAMFDATGLHDELGEKREEKVCNRLAKVLLPALRENPAFLEFLLEDVPRRNP